MQLFTALTITFLFALVGSVFVRLQVRPLSGLTPKQNEAWKALAEIACGTGINILSIAIYESFITARKPLFSFVFEALSPVTIRAMILGALIGTLIFNSCRTYQLHLQRKIRESDGATLLRTIWKALTIALILEITLFNFRHHEQFFQQTAERRIFSLGDFHLEGFKYDTDSNQLMNDPSVAGHRSISIEFDPLDVHGVRFAFAPNEPTGMYELTIENALTGETYKPMQIHMTSSLPRSLIIPIDTVGKSRKLTLSFPELSGGMTYYFRLPEIELNPEIPFRFETSRFAFLFVVFWLFLILHPRNPIAAKPLDLKSPLQRVISIIILIIIIFELAWAIASNYTHLQWTGNIRADIETFNRFRKNKIEYYCAYYETTDAILAGQFHLLDEPDESLSNAEYPYDPTYRIAKNVAFKWDRAFFNGKYYSYFGVVPVFIAFLPFKVITGLDLPLDILMFIFAVMAVIGLKKIVTLIIFDHFPNCSFGLYCLSFFGVITASQIPWLARRTLMYEIANAGGITFSIWAVYWMMTGVKRFAKIVEDPSLSNTGHRIPFALSGLCAGLAVGCRPNTVFILIWLAFLAWEIKPILRFIPRKKLISAFLSFSIPISLIAPLLMAYNFARFGSITEFGFTYQLSFPNAYIASLRISPLGLIFNCLAYLFQPLSVSFEFPFVTLSQLRYPLYVGYIPNEPYFAGLFASPFFWSLVLLILPIRKKYFDPGSRQFIGSLVASALFLGTTATVGVYFRYISDFAWIIAIFSLVGWLTVHQKGEGRTNHVQKSNLSYFFAVIATSIVGFFLTLQGIDNWHSFMNPGSYERLRYLFSFWL